MTHVVVTGATGFVGKALSRRLSREEDVSVESVSRSLGYDLLDPAWHRVLDEPVDVVYHLAAHTFVPDSWRDPGRFLDNVRMTGTALEFARQRDARFVYLSSYVYGEPEYLPVDEGHPVRPNNPYAQSKVMCEELCRFYHLSFGLKTTVLRPFNIYGPGQPLRYVVPTIIEQVVEADSVVVQDAAPRRDFLHINDLAEALIAVLDTEPEGFEIYNLGSAGSHSIRDIAEMAAEASGHAVELIDLKRVRPNEIDDCVADTTLFRAAFQWQPRIPFGEGIADLVERALRVKQSMSSSRE